MNFLPMKFDNMKIGLMIIAGALLAAAHAGGAQQAVSRADATAAAVARSPRIALARADSTAAHAGLLTARRFENPVFLVSHSKSVPQNHFSFDIPLDYPWLRKARIGAASYGLGAARYRFEFDRATISFDADTAYTNALAAARRAEYSRRTAREADSLLTLARLRRDGGDGTELDVQLATVSAGQLANVAARDSLDATTALLWVQALMGLASEAPTIRLADSLSAALVYPENGPGLQLLVAAAAEDLRQADQSLLLERRLMFGAPALSLGWESHDPTGTEPGVLPTIGIALPLPLFNQNHGQILQAQANRDRANAVLTLTTLEGAQQAARARRELAAAQDRLARSAQLVAGANTVARLSLVAYREGAFPLASVLEAQRTARETLAQYIDDVAAASNAAAVLHLLTLTVHRNDP